MSHLLETPKLNLCTPPLFRELQTVQSVSKRFLKCIPQLLLFDGGGSWRGAARRHQLGGIALWLCRLVHVRFDDFFFACDVASRQKKRRSSEEGTLSTLSNNKTQNDIYQMISFKCTVASESPLYILYLIIQGRSGPVQVSVIKDPIIFSLNAQFFHGSLRKNSGG